MTIIAPLCSLPCLHYLACKVSHPVNEASRFIQHLSILTVIWCCYPPFSTITLSVGPCLPESHLTSRRVVLHSRDFIIYCHNYMCRFTTLRAPLYELAIGEGVPYAPRDYSFGDILQKNASKVHADRSRRFSSLFASVRIQDHTTGSTRQRVNQDFDQESAETTDTPMDYQHTSLAAWSQGAIHPKVSDHSR